MNIIIGYIVIIAVIGLLFMNRKFNKRMYTFICALGLFLISSLRSIYFTTDVIGYVTAYERFKTIDFVHFLNNFTIKEKDPFFDLISKVFVECGINYRWWLIIIAALFCFSIYFIVYKYSSNIFLSYIMLISLGYFYFSLSGLRQTVALSIILFSYKYLKNRNFKKFFLIVIFASLFHASAIIFLLIYPISNMKVDFKSIIIILFFLIIAYTCKYQIIKILSFMNIGDKYSYYIDSGTTLTISGFLIQFSIYLFCLKYKKDLIKLNKKNVILYNLLFVGVIFQSFAAVIAEFFRISMYFSIFGIILLPKAINIEKNKKLRICLYYAIIVLLIIYILKRNDFVGFEFLWRE